MPSTEALETRKQTEAEEAAIEALAEEFDEEWRKTRFNKETGTFEPRIKTTTDEVWIAAHGTDQVDIANTDFQDLPEDWQAENEAAAEVVIDVLEEHDGDVDLDDPTVRSEVGSIIHEAWLDRNEWADGTDLDVPFDQLSPEEQAKDIAQVIEAEELFTGQK